MDPLRLDEPDELDEREHAAEVARGMAIDYRDPNPRRELPDDEQLDAWVALDELRRARRRG